MREHGFLGAPIAKHVIETYFAKKEGRPLPVLPPKPARRATSDAGSPAAMLAQPVADARAGGCRPAAQASDR